MDRNPHIKIIMLQTSANTSKNPGALTRAQQNTQEPQKKWPGAWVPGPGLVLPMGPGPGRLFCVSWESSGFP